MKKENRWKEEEGEGERERQRGERKKEKTNQSSFFITLCLLSIQMAFIDYR